MDKPHLTPACISLIENISRQEYALARCHSHVSVPIARVKEPGCWLDPRMVAMADAADPSVSANVRGEMEQTLALLSGSPHSHGEDIAAGAACVVFHPRTGVLSIEINRDEKTLDFKPLCASI